MCRFVAYRLLEDNVSEFSIYLQAAEAGRIQCQFKGFAMGNSWISPCDSLATWGPFLPRNGNVNH